MSARSTSLFTPSTPFSPGPQTGRAQVDRQSNSAQPAVGGGAIQLGMLAPRPTSHVPRPSAFTLVELLTVITIIGILAGLASVAAYQVFVVAKGAAIKTDITNLESALSKYELTYGDYPPSNMYDAQAIRRHLLKYFGKSNVDYEMQFIPDKYGVIDTTTPYANRVTLANENAMTPAQALVFWLQGFCTDKQRPLSAAYSATPAERVAVIDFNKARLIDPSTKQAWVAPSLNTSSPYLPLSNVPPPVYVASSGEQPFVYFDARSYLWHALDPTKGTYAGSAGSERICPYLLQPWDNDGQNDIDTGTGSNVDVREDNSGNILASGFQKICANPKSFQIISAGVDGDYGTTDNRASVQFAGSNIDLYFKSFPDGFGYVDGDNDNMTNFSDKALGDAKPE